MGTSVSKHVQGSYSLRDEDRAMKTDGKDIEKTLRCDDKRNNNVHSQQHFGVVLK